MEFALRRIFFLFCIVINYCYADNSPAQLTYDFSGSNSWVPYYIPNEYEPGILAELVPKLLIQANIVGKEVKLPPKRTNSALISGELDFDLVCKEWFPNQDVGPYFVMSDAVFEIKEYIVSLQNTPSTNSIVGKNIGTVRGYYYYDDALFNRIDFKSERELILALKKGRVKRILIGDLPARYWSKKEGVGIKFDYLHTQGQLRIRLNKQKRHLLPRLNTAIKILKNDNTVANIVNKYKQLQFD